jgi:hypothetical protein
MPKAAPKVQKGNPGMMLVMTFFVTFIVNVIVIHLANTWFPKQVVLGTMSLSVMWALLLSSGKLAVIETLALPFLRQIEIMRNKMLSPIELLISFAVIIVVSLWAITRFSQVFGLGVSSVMVVIVLSLVLDFVQGMVMMVIEQMKNR